MASLSPRGEILTDVPPFIVRRYTDPKAFLDDSYNFFLQEETSSNILLAHAMTKSSEETPAARPLTESGDPQFTLTTTDPASPSPAASPDFWLVVWTKTSDPQPLLFLSSISWKLGAYPIFLWSPKANTNIAPEERSRQMRAIVQCLNTQVQPQRVFSVFGKGALVTNFAELWKEETGFETEPEPFYDAFLTHCTKRTLKPSAYSANSSDTAPELPSGHSMHIATMDDLHSVAERCKEFADDSIYFPMTLESAEIEATMLIRKQQIWVYTVDGEAVSICAVTRTTVNVAGVTKVFTKPTSRKKGFAERLVRMVTAQLLKNKSAVVLYVGVTNDAQHVYDKIGFVGLCGKEDPDVESALELGFKGTTRGHW
ncbi:hypothetical protein SCHPADRAFT_816691 [Schizopora paradoxa]|uniref:N-acetyltransferase domain-containing protein n=1 Tax=Schizopora paradoxa TaxID=27342 RepID=A0A0H2S770_9AGAM|nr:hypothetical protein SCHPADRAFT_816691 [Schizopora paradoxa]